MTELKTEIAVQTWTLNRNYVSCQVGASQPQVVPSGEPLWYERPHTLAILCIALGGMMIAGSILDEFSLTPFQHIGIGLIASCLTFLVCATLQFPDGILVRPCLCFWRLVLGASILYLFLLTFLIFQKLEDVKWVLQQLNPGIEKQAEQDLGFSMDCSLSAVRSSLDIFVIAHFFGWLVKALIIRDLRILWFLSIMFEWTEMSLQHILPNFVECWWDFLLLDVFGCNMLGIIVGMKLCRLLQMKKYSWGWNRTDRKERQHSPYQWLSLLTPYEWTNYTWPPLFSSYRKFFGLLIYSVAVTVVDINVFILKAELRLPNKHWYNFAHTAFWAIAAAPTTREYYEFITDKNCKRLGLQCWLSCALVIAEMILVFRWRYALVSSHQMPTWIYNTWVFLIIPFAVGTTLFLYARREKK